MNRYLESYLLNNLCAETKQVYVNCEWQTPLDDNEEE